MVGTVYLAPQPGTPPFVRLGDIVTEGQPLLIIEAMKVMNQIRAHRAGRVGQIVVADAQPVEFGAVLMLSMIFMPRGLVPTLAERLGKGR